MKRPRGIPGAPSAPQKAIKIESKPLPTLAMSALEMANAEFNRIVQGLGKQTLDMMGLKREDGWIVDFNRKIAFRPKKHGGD